MDFIGAADENGDIIEYNPAALKAFGYTMDELKRLEVRELYAHDEDYDNVVKALQETGKFAGEVLNKRKNGEEFTCYLSANMVYNDEGKIVGSMGISRDISKEKELAKELEIQNQKNAELLEEQISLSRIATSVANGIVIANPDRSIKWANDSFLRISGYSMSELEGKRAHELFRIPHFYEDNFKKLTEGDPIFDTPFQMPLYHKNGHLYWILMESSGVYDDDGSLIEIIVVCTEITDQKNAEMALVESEANFRQMADTIEDVFFLYSVYDKQYEYMSPYCSEIMGVTADFFYDGKEYINAYVHEKDRHKIRRGRLDLVNGLAYDIEYRIHINGQVRWLHERAYPIRNEEEEIIKGSGIVSDITQLKFNRELIDLQNKNISESISYAKHIQNSTLQDIDDIQRVFPNSFLYFQPKAELSGDFYIVDEIQTNNDDTYQAFIVADCTGHGVPGAILSILCSSLMKQSFTNREIDSPAEALNVIRHQLSRLFDSGDSLKIKDGMDVGFGIINKEKKLIRYSGAHFTAFVLRDNDWIELRGSIQHVGHSDDPKPFENIDFTYESGDQLYLFTDGFVDQFGGGNNKKYMKRKLMDFVKSIGHESMEIQRGLIEIEFLNWKGKEEQTDDICCFGLRLD